MIYTNRADLLIAAGESMKMQAKAGCIPVFKWNGRVEINDGDLTGDPEDFEFPIAVIEGKPVFVGDNLYVGNDLVSVKGKHKDYDGLLYSIGSSTGNAGFETFSWNPPEPKTVMVEMSVEEAKIVSRWGDSFEFVEACRKALDKQNPVEIKPEDIRIDTYRVQRGGFDNGRDTCVRIIHIPTGKIVESNSERSQHANKAKAMEMLKEQLGIK